MRNLYVLVVLVPGSRRKVLARFASRRPWVAPEPGEVIRPSGKPLRVVRVSASVVRAETTIEHRLEVETRAVRKVRRPKRPPLPRNVVPMPVGDGSVVATFLRYHVLIRVFDGNPDAWLAHLESRPPDDATSGDIRFARWVRARLRQDPALIAAIRTMVDTTPFWRVVAR